MKKILIIGIILSLFSCNKKEKYQENEEKGILSWEDIEASYVGSFLVPSGRGEDENQNFSYSNGAFCMLNEETIILEGHNYSKQVRQLDLPKVLNGAEEATVVGQWFDPTGGLLSTGHSDINYYGLGDLITIKDKIYFTKYSWYNLGEDYDSFGYLQKTSSFANGTAHGLWNANHELAHNLRIGGYLCHTPKSLKNKGITFLAGQEGSSGNAMGRWGPNLFAVKFDSSKPIGAPMDVVPLIVHPSKDKAPANWWIANKVHSMAWIETSTKEGVLVLFTKGYGDTWYGEAYDNNPPDPYGGYKGYHSSGKQLVAWIYDPADLIKVYKGELNPYELQPKQEKILIDLKPGNSKGMEIYNSFITKNGGHRMDMYNNRLIIMQQSRGEDYPKGYVIDFK